ncbi:MAG TPA: dephospho-CoA kinase [Solirubrobacteraceae bacterium]|nr:dephospho-CoA kinase [Solirubrobacteraceae bacterium]
MTASRRRRPTSPPKLTQKPDRIPFVGLTGGIGAGKSTALQALERAGAAVLSTDRVVHELYGDDDVVSAVVARFGNAIERDGVIDRAALARVAFATASDREWLEGLLWPRVAERMASWRASLPDGVRAAVVEVPLLFESGMDGAFDATIAVIASEDLRASRAGARGHEALDARSARQLTQKEKAHRATYVVVNDGTVEELESKLSSVLEKLRS